MSQRNPGILDGNRFKMGIFDANWAIFGEPDHVARELKRLHQAGFDGVAIDFINYLDELPYFVQEVIPRLERMGIRRPAL